MTVTFLCLPQGIRESFLGAEGSSQDGTQHARRRSPGEPGGRGDPRRPRVARPLGHGTGMALRAPHLVLSVGLSSSFTAQIGRGHWVGQWQIWN